MTNEEIINDENAVEDEVYEEASEYQETGQPQQESKADKFKRLATMRTNNALKAMNGLGKLASSSYEYTPEQVEKIFQALQKTLDNAKDKFTKKAEEEEEFTL